MTKRGYSVGIVVPCYHEDTVIPTTIPILIQYMHGLLEAGTVAATSFRVTLVDDGSRDSTWFAIKELAQSNPEIIGVKLTRNYGHQSALLAGLSRTSADVAITLDADLQDDISAIEKMLLHYESGSDFVLGVRENRDSDTPFKRNTANAYYSLMSIMGVNIVNNHADFRLSSRRALNALLAHDEVNLFLRGIVPTIGYQTSIVTYARRQREHGEAKYTLLKMIGLALDGITSFSVVPLRLVTFLGAAMFVSSCIASAWVLSVAIYFSNRAVPGWASTALPILFLGGVQLLCVGILGEYVGKIYMEVKRRPRFFIEQTIP